MVLGKQKKKRLIKVTIKKTPKNTFYDTLHIDLPADKKKSTSFHDEPG